jgi:peptidoglycan/xylan/chitin deacetylase (PgdA/CDA1 family)
MMPVVTPKILKQLFPQLIWDITTTEKKIYLTFDDGPEPFITKKVLGLLHQFNARATFFCLGEKAEQHPELISLIKTNGHAVCNHGYKHISGFTSGKKRYVDNCIKGADVIQSTLFRPPYGRITPWQIKALSQQFKIIQWSIMSMDFSSRATPDECTKNVINNIYPGAIVVFHDTQQAFRNLEIALPAILETLQNKGFKFEGLY